MKVIWLFHEQGDGFFFPEEMSGAQGAQKRATLSILMPCKYDSSNNQVVMGVLLLPVKSSDKQN